MANYLTANVNKSPALELNQQEHMETEEGSHTCVLCGAGFDTWEAVNVHLQTHGVQTQREQEDVNVAADQPHTIVHPHTCVLCGAGFDTWDAVNAHLQTHNVVKPYKCSVCTESFNTERDLAQHALTHTEHKPSVCNIRSQTSPASYQRTGQRPHACPECGKEFTRAADMRRHMTIHMCEKTYNCAPCGQQFADAGSFKTHMMIHAGENPHKCPVCGRCYIDAAYLNQHMKTHPSQKVHQCSKCADCFYTEHDLIKHTQKHQTGTQLDDNNVLRTPQDELLSRIGKKTTMSLNVCTVCHKVFLRPAELLQHMRSHVQDTAQPNPRTAQLVQPSQPAKKTTPGFNEPSSLAIAQPNTGSAQHHSQPHQDPAHKANGSRQAIEPLMCRYCGNWFDDLAVYRRHHLTHTQRGFKCSQCGMKFPNQRYLDNHSWIHRGKKKSFRCVVCSKKFKCPKSLYDHLQEKSCNLLPD